MDNNYIEDIKLIIQNFIETEYKKYLFDQQILIIENKKLQDIISQIYDNNIKTIKKEIRDQLKEKYQNEYSSLKVENIIIDIFNDKMSNINKIVEEILFIQNLNLKFITIPIINNSLNLNISLIDNYLVINYTNIKSIDLHQDIYNEIDEYKFLYQVNDKIIQDYANTEKINIIKNEILNKTECKIGIYYKKQNKIL
tara:strand:- start:79 stop:669 length:591 start_codon:yes stop_codon:yes gene_type:complete